ncbi:MAG: tripartite tricarboxylate transporter permease [Deltaproteobacteria bacterium]|jgi:putative tricarboxylic transport membrane protein|nr:tripartite tricarboxylate transporter permease [Deltaproteobacteria bacterium]
MFENVLYGFSIALDPINLLYCFFGVLIGTLVGVLPGVGPPVGIALLLPVTYQAPPSSTIILLAGIYYGAMYGGSTTSILLNMPGEAASVVTCLDGYVMARKGRAGPALGISAFGSFIGGTVGIIGLMIIGPPLARWALKFGPAEYFSLMVLGLTLLTFLGSKSMIRALMMAVLGLFISTIGVDYISGKPRFTYHIMSLMDGLDIVPVVMGLFGVAEVLINIEAEVKKDFYETKIKNIFPTLQDWKDSIGPIIRGSFLGFFVGILPGPSAVIASFTSYTIEKKISKKKFGTGVIEGVAGPETANNAGATGAFVPLLTLGLPGNPATAILIGALMIHGVTPGPMLMRDAPEIFWGVITSMYVGNAMLLVLNLPLIPLWVKFLRLPYYVLFPLILIFCVIGSYSLSNSVADVFTMILFGLFGYLLRKFDYEAAPLIMALVLGKMFENAFRQSLIISGGSFSIFFTRPVSAVLLIIAFGLLVSPIFLRRKVVQEAGD